MDAADGETRTQRIRNELSMGRSGGMSIEEVDELMGDLMTPLGDGARDGGLDAARVVPQTRSRTSQGTSATVPLPPKSNKLLSYDGKTPFRDYLKTFERVSEINNWNLQQKCDTLVTNLTGAAQQVYTDAPEEVGRRRDCKCSPLPVPIEKNDVMKKVS